MVTQAEHIIKKSGGQTALAGMLGCRQSAIQAWTKRGFVPARRYSGIAEAWDRAGIPWDERDFVAHLCDRRRAEGQEPSEPPVETEQVNAV